MDLEKELDRRTAPASIAGKVRQLSPEEIAQLQAAGKITPPEQIPAKRYNLRYNVPSSWGAGTGRRLYESIHD